MARFASPTTASSRACVYGWIEPFYEKTGAAIEPGHIWCDQPIYLPPRHALKIERVSPHDDRDLDFRVGGRTADTFDHPPVRSLRLESSEAAVVAKAKKDRPVVILGGTSATDLRPQSSNVADVVMVVPVYGADQYDEHTRRRISYYEFTNVFYLPAHGAPPFDDGFARLDQVQPVPQSHLSRHRGLKLSSDALDALIEWFVYCTTDRIPDDSVILDYRREMLADRGLGAVGETGGC
jgi:hypothetical protein